MYLISDNEIDFILADLSARGIETEGLQHDLLDHICIIIEENLEAGGDFERFYFSTVSTFYKQELREIEEETQFLLKTGPHIVLSRNLFFLLLLVLVGGPFAAPVLSWMIRMGPAEGWDMPEYIWAKALVFSLFPLLVLLVLYLTPDRLDPVIPWKSKVLIGIRPFIQIVTVG